MTSPASASPRLSVVVPCFNEEVRLPEALRTLVPFLSALPGGFEIIVVDDGSRDGTADAARSFSDPRVRLVTYPRNRGKGHAVREGVARARGERVLFCDADLSTGPEDLQALEEALDDGADVAVGSRDLPGSRLLERQPWWREGLGRLFNRVVRLIAPLDLRDTQCGFKLFTRAAAGAIFPRVRAEGWSFDVEVLLLARKLGFQVREVPVSWANSAASRFSVLRHGLPTCIELLRIRLRWARRDPGQEAPPCTREAGGGAGVRDLEP